MSRPIKYIRHPWTHRSDFQKTKGYSTIDLEECTISGVKSFAPDSDDELSGSERIAKRRRIEKLAEGYVKGEPLFISSARPCPQNLKRAIAWHKKSSTEPRYVVPEVNTSGESAQIWKDVEDDDQILRRLVRSSKSKQRLRKTEVDQADVDDVHAESVEDVQVQASCKPQRRLRTTRVEVGPSEDALRQAAALRNRKARTKATEMTKVAEEAATEATPASDPGDCISVTQSDRMLRTRHDKSEWLSRRKSRFSFGGNDGNGSSGAASSPCIAPSTPQSTGKTQASLRWSTSRPSAPDSSEHFLEPVEAASLVRSGGPEEHWSPDEESHTLPRRPRRSPDVATPGQHLEPGSGVDADVQAKGECSRSSQQKAPENRHDLDQPLIPTSVDGTGPEGPLPSTGTRSAPATTAENPVDATERAYVQAPSTQNGTTPLMYRKRANRPKPSEPEQAEPPRRTTRHSNRRRITFPSSEDPQVDEARSKKKDNVASHPPLLDMSFRPDYSFAPNLNMALVDEHVNRMLPTEEGASDRKTSTKKALRRELRNSGAEITRCGSEPPPSSQAEEAAPVAQPDVPASDGPQQTAEPERPKESNSERRQTWLGTQAMVARAERDLFTSPEKHRGAFTPINEASALSHGPQASEDTPRSQEREPLKQLSQEPAPSTQAMLEAFGGFSTVKKPRNASSWDKRADEGTPVAVEKGKRSDARVVSEPLRSSFGFSKTLEKARENRGSSLRFSISSFESPEASRPEHSNEPPSATAPSATRPETYTTSFATPAPSSSARRSAQPTKSALKPSHPPPATDPTTHRNRTSALFSQSQTESQSTAFPELTCFQAAQDPNGMMSSASVGLLRDPSDFDATIEDLSRDVLGLGEMGEGVLSQ